MLALLPNHGYSTASKARPVLLLSLFLLVVLGLVVSSDRGQAAALSENGSAIGVPADAGEVDLQKLATTLRENERLAVVVATLEAVRYPKQVYEILAVSVSTVPDRAHLIAAAIARRFPDQATELARTAAFRAPEQALRIGDMIAEMVPERSVEIRRAVADSLDMFGTDVQVKPASGKN